MYKRQLSTFSFTKSFYEGKLGFIIQILLIVITFACYILVRKLKDNGSVDTGRNMQNPWEQKLYSKKIIRKFINLIMPKKGTKEYRLKTKLMKESATKLKMEWLYIDRCMSVSYTHLHRSTSRKRHNR